ncbi:hypothetical protein Pmar_PMAR000081 [Perkinsus marinus ATCC 50983]|uniref:Clathrin light chain n=1 Tax=Perkinsus marinus (strain ATCC 50983 / TXsc) TaxID=423536 RepID=C5KPU7_PERM5|nr:hypothetical protein Pmar_PMAR000081 [Perkinsus marinus ATCC 50983]EER13494.1 hypothetical protein Pmar_PMAR000081 [Perkinsus marinus ATCC 50983]|eukprot:XP_002781699.1 hypothetical protein Pmar_PMAR000081 [Perkinsus marinus ATCC 50983]
MLSSESDSPIDFDTSGSDSVPDQLDGPVLPLESPLKQSDGPPIVDDNPIVESNVSDHAAVDSTSSDSKHHQQEQQHRTVRTSTLTEDDCMTLAQEEDEAKKTIRREAQEAIKSFYDERQCRIEENKKNNLAEMENIESSKLRMLDKAASNKTPWVVIAEHVNFVSLSRGISVESQGSSGEQVRRSKDLDAEVGTRSRMKMLMKELRNDEVARGTE